MKRQKRFTKEDQLIQAIDMYRARADEYLKLATAEDAAADACLAKARQLEDAKNKPRMVQLIINKYLREREQHQKEAERLNKSRNRILESTLPRYGQALSAFKTGTLPFTDDKAVVLGPLK